MGTYSVDIPTAPDIGSSSLRSVVLLVHFLLVIFENMNNVRPKPPHNAFMLFCEKYREEVKRNIIASNMKSNHRQVAPPKDVARNLGERWRNADETSKKEFVDRFSKAYEKYKVDLSTWKSENEVKNKGRDTCRVEDRSASNFEMSISVTNSSGARSPFDT